MRLVRAGDDEQAGGVAVEPVHDSRPVVVVPAFGAERQQPVDEGARTGAAGRVHDEPGRLVDDEQVLVLPEDRESIASGSQREHGRELDVDALPAAEAVALRPPLAVDERGAVGDQALGKRAGRDLGPLGEDAVEPRARLARQRRESGAVPTRGLVRSAATNERKRSADADDDEVSARLNAGHQRSR